MDSQSTLESLPPVSEELESSEPLLLREIDISEDSEDSNNCEFICGYLSVETMWNFLDKGLIFSPNHLNCTVLLPKRNSFCRKSCAKGLGFKSHPKDCH